ncbi:RHS repeat-associated core domain-containing protein [Pseudomonas lundensis]|uniref:RHS repeat-associated core domain-containing protein n=1 Tax=Pseudomonas lundensis TaxID=86185 RepID=UPI00069993D8|nr:RHS repeat-associated core domain-containing protein [Pseudomonas lundensis]NNA28781.1 RHS repeat-associated core domain-containing protein [Pseudomonas lundensis]NNA38210.1 RHS repeat-associated core domain-containing protein [Pseudomonas lundensis]
MTCVRYRYDPLDRLIANQVDTTPSVQHFYNRERLSTRLQGDQGQSVFHYQNQLLATADTTGKQLLVTNLQRSVLHTLSADGSHASGYGPYGYPSVQHGQQSLLGFNGELPDPVTGHYLLGNGHRAYNPVLMRFNSPDRLSPFSAGGINAYAYCKGDPVNRVDPSGRLPLNAILSIALASLSLAHVINGAVPGIGFWSALKNLKKKPLSVAALAKVAGTGVGLTASVVGLSRQVVASKGEGDNDNALLWATLGLSALGLAAGIGANAFGWKAMRQQARQARLAKAKAAYVDTLDDLNEIQQGFGTRSSVSNSATPASSASVSRSSSSAGAHPEPSAPPHEEVFQDSVRNMERQNHVLKELAKIQTTAGKIRRSAL